MPENVRRNATAIFGSTEWLDALPGVVADLCARWDVAVDGPGMTGGSFSYVAPVRLADGSRAVLKVAMPGDDESTAEPTALYHYAGDGAVRLHAYAPEAGAMLLERAYPGRALVDEPDRAGALVAACALFRRLWRVPGPTPPGYPEIPRVTDLAAEWARTLPDRVCEPFPAGLVHRAAAVAAEYVAPAGPEGLGNRDGHLGNVLSAEREPWLLIDPKPVIGERAFDAGFPVARGVVADPAPDAARELLAVAADGLGVDRARAAGWAFIRAVSSGLWHAECHTDGPEWLAAAEVLGRLAGA